MVNAVEHHPAMLLYLDQAQSLGPDSLVGQRRAQRAGVGGKVGLNENLAREIMELHTLGVRSGYSQTDVTEFARAMTGWSVGGLRKLPQLGDVAPGFVFVPAMHQPGNRQIIGRSYGQQGEQQAQAVLRDLAQHPATAHHLATKLARHFGADDPPPALVARLEKSYLASGGDLPTLYRALIASPEVWSGPRKFRTPWEWGIAAMRLAGVEQLPPGQAVGLFQQLGQPVWKPGSPAGYDDIAASWAAPDALLRRVEAAQRIAAKAGAIDARALAEAAFPGSLSETTRTAIARAESPVQATTLLLSAPEILWR